MNELSNMESTIKTSVEEMLKKQRVSLKARAEVLKWYADPNCGWSPFLQFLEVTNFSDEKKRGQFTIMQRKKKREIIEEGNNEVNIPPDVGEEEKKALEQTGDDATSGW